MNIETITLMVAIATLFFSVLTYIQGKRKDKLKKRRKRAKLKRLRELTRLNGMFDQTSGNMVRMQEELLDAELRADYDE